MQAKTQFSPHRTGCDCDCECVAHHRTNGVWCSQLAACGMWHAAAASAWAANTQSHILYWSHHALPWGQHDASSGPGKLPCHAMPLSAVAVMACMQAICLQQGRHGPLQAKPGQATRGSPQVSHCRWAGNNGKKEAVAHSACATLIESIALTKHQPASGGGGRQGKKTFGNQRVRYV